MKSLHARGTGALAATILVLLVGCGSSHPTGTASAEPPGHPTTDPGVATAKAPTTAATTVSTKVGTIRRIVQVGGFVDGLAVDKRILWASDLQGNRVVRYDLDRHRLLPDIPLAAGPLTVAEDGAGVWVASYQGTTVTRLDATTGKPTAKVTTRSASPCGLVPVGSRLWIFDQSDGAGTLVDGTTGKVLRRVATKAQSGYASLAFGSVWVTDFTGTSGTVQRLDPETGRRLGAVRTGQGPIMATPGAGTLWVANSKSDTLSQVDPRSGAVRRQVHLPGSTPVSVTVAQGSVWVAGYTGNAIYRIAPSTGHVMGSLTMPGPAENMVAVGSDLWVTVSTGQLVDVAMAK